ncbi:MAG TPA: sugar ABC transporter permease [Lachnospiraceae bacterium]|nr:sugar ABC transporter permease [Lachnospiraceae bacterium]
MISKKRLTLTQRRAITGYLFIMPWIIGFIWFYARSLFMAGQFSLSTLQMKETGGFTLDFVGLSNFKYAIFEDATFNQILFRSIGDMVIDVPLIIFFSLFMAIILNSKFKGRTLIRAIFFLPIILNAGAINDALTLARAAATGGVAAVSAESVATAAINVDYFFEIFMDLGVPVSIIEYITLSVARIYDIVQASGVQIIIFIAALQSVGGSLYEVAKIEGATAYETFWKITFPMVSPLIITNVVYTIVDSFVDSAVVDKAYDMAFTSFNWGTSVAMSLISSAIVCGILLVVGKLLSKKTFYYN